MQSQPLGRCLVVGVTPLGEPIAAVVAAVERAGGLGVLDLGRDRGRALAALADAARWVPASFGVRVGPGCPVTPADLPPEVDTVVLASGSPWTAADAAERLVLVEVCSGDEADAALAAGADGIIARGAEAGGRVGELTTFVLLQTLLAHLPADVPVWAAGGIGLHTAAAAVAGGAVGVVLDTQLALVREAVLPRETAAAIAAMDGSETVVVGGHRVFTRPDLAVDGIGDVTLRLGSDLHTHLVPVGQDGALARPLADRFVTAGGVVQAVQDSIRAHLTTAATGGGLRHRVVQGPMTRVSDRAAFALAVAENGGLPFLALALMTGDEVRRLLTETSDLLGDLPWGVGILGFTPPEVREAQLAVVHDVRPPYALIAGGRPSQAAPLEAAGIATYLHVPSPGLLDRFLREGARRFVFEGFECGGHVGPRASFPLWDTQIERLLAVPEAVPDLHILFAGGIADERSAAMVAAAAAPLSAAGASVGVLMGTAYLFTEEAVAAGAILPGFQRQAVECRETVLLETSPGHATRCAPTPYVEAFDEARGRLTASGASQQEMWAELEQLNLGRLRIASKGLKRDGGRLATVDETDQQRDGMYMIGQVAALRDDVTTIASPARPGHRRGRRLPHRTGVGAGPRPGRRRPVRRRPSPRYRHRGDGLHLPGRARRGRFLGQRGGGGRFGHRGARHPLGPRPLLRPRLVQGPPGRARRRSGAGSSRRCRSTPSPTASPRRRWWASSRCSCWRWRSRPGPWPTPATEVGARSGATARL